jgi:hypothetical protein
MGRGFLRAGLVLVCLGVVLGTVAGAQETVAKQSDEPVNEPQAGEPACGGHPCGGNPCGPCGAGYGVGGYGAGGYGASGYGAGGYGAGAYGAGGYGGTGGGAAGTGSFGAFGAAGGAGVAGPGAGAAPYMIGDLLQANRVLQFSYARTNSDNGTYGAPLASGVYGVVNIRNTKVAENNNAIPTDRFAYEYNFFKNGMSVTGTSRQRGNTHFPALGAVHPDTGLEQYFPQTNFRAKTANYDVHVHTFTYEKTFLCGLGSVEVRMPFAQGLGSDLDLSAGQMMGVNYWSPDVVLRDALVAAGVAPAQADLDATYYSLRVRPTPWDTRGTVDWELQDISLIFKFLLHHNPCRDRYLSAGVQLVAPSAKDVGVRVTDYQGMKHYMDLNFDGQPQYEEFIGYADTSILRIRSFEIENETWALSPFLALTSKPSPRTFFNGFLQVDIPLGNNTVRFTQDYFQIQEDQTNPDSDLDLKLVNINDDPRLGPAGEGLTPEYTGEVADQTLMHVDVAVGYWMYLNPCARVIKAVMPTAEFHLTQTLSDPDRLVLPESGFHTITESPTGDPGEAPTGDIPAEPAPVVGNPADSNTITDVTVGVHTLLGESSMLSVGGVFPLGDGWDRTFDSEIAVKFNHAF